MDTLTDRERVKIRHHLGYLNVQNAQTFVLGVPAAVDTQFLIEGAFDKVLPEALGEVRRHLVMLDNVEAQIAENQELLAVTKVGEISVRQDEFEALLVRYDYWRNGLSNLLGVYPNPWDKRRIAGPGINVRVRH